VSLLLANLVDKSMVQLVDENLPRYRLLETLREYGRDRLSEEDRYMVRARHAAWYLEVAERCARLLAGSDELTGIQMLDWDFDNLRAAHRWSIEPTADSCVATSKEPSNSVGRPSLLLVDSASTALASLNAHLVMPGSTGATMNKAPNGRIE
jgi:hypothetical protein